MNGEKTKEKNNPEDLTVDDISYFKYAPVTLVDVKRFEPTIIIRV